MCRASLPEAVMGDAMRTANHPEVLITYLEKSRNNAEFLTNVNQL
jgi:hypothetical protein